MNMLLSIAKLLQHNSWIVAISSSVVMSVIVVPVCQPDY
jgi:hypothetical protein